MKDTLIAILATSFLVLSSTADAYDWNKNDSYNSISEGYEIGQPMKTIDNARERRAASIQRKRNQRMDDYLMMQELDRIESSNDYYSYDD